MKRLFYFFLFVLSFSLAEASTIWFFTTPPTEATVGDEYSYYARARTEDTLGVINYSLTVAPEGMTVESNGHVLWTPTETGNFDVTLKAELNDDPDVSTTQSWVITVTESVPEIHFTTSPPTTGYYGEEYLYNAIAVGNYSGYTITYSLVTAPPDMNVNASTGQVTWTPGTANVSVELLATDESASLSATQSWTIIVTSPTVEIVSEPETTADIGVNYYYHAIAHGTDSAQIDWELVSGPDGMTVNTYGEINWTPTEEGSFDVTLKAMLRTNHSIFDTQTWTIVVTEGEPEITFTSTPPSTAEIDMELTYYAVAVGNYPDYHILYSLVEAPSGMDISAGSGLIRWIPRETGVFPVTVRATDSVAGLHADQSWNITIGGGSDSTFTLTIPPPDSAVVGEEYVYDIEISYSGVILLKKDGSAILDSGTTFTFNLLKSPQGMKIQSNPTSARITWTPEQTGSFAVSLAVAVNGKNIQKVFDWTIEVTDGGSGGSIEIISEPETEVILYELYTYQVKAKTEDNSILKYTLVEPPICMSINEASGMIAWIPKELGKFSVTVRVEKLNSSVHADQTWEIEVKENTQGTFYTVTGQVVCSDGTTPFSEIEVKFTPVDKITGTPLDATIKRTAVKDVPDNKPLEYTASLDAKYNYIIKATATSDKGVFSPQWYNKKDIRTDADILILDSDKSDINFYLTKVSIDTGPKITGHLKEGIRPQKVYVSVITRWAEDHDDIAVSRGFFRNFESDPFGNFEIPYSSECSEDDIIFLYPEYNPLTQSFVPGYVGEDGKLVYNWSEARKFNMKEQQTDIELEIILEEISGKGDGESKILGDLSEESSMINDIDTSKKIDNYILYLKKEMLGLLDEPVYQVVDYILAKNGGSYDFDNLPYGNYELIASKLGFEPYSRAIATSEENKEVIQDIDLEIMVGIDDEEMLTFGSYVSPNPANGNFNINFKAEYPCPIVLKIYNELGVEVFSASIQVYSPNCYSIPVNLSGLFQGLYFYNLSLGNKVETGKIVLLK
ncbi:MAG: putative Ig domain-containing protein [bacterium]